MFTHRTSAAQRRHLDIANAEIPRLDRLTELAHVHPLTGHEWECAASIAAGIADQLDKVAELAESTEAAQYWADSAQYWHKRSDYYTLWSDLAESAVEIIKQHQDQP